jgi:hypothetical protein
MRASKLKEAFVFLPNSLLHIVVMNDDIWVILIIQLDDNGHWFFRPLKSSKCLKFNILYHKLILVIKVYFDIFFHLIVNTRKLQNISSSAVNN